MSKQSGSKQQHLGFFCAAGEKITLLMQMLVANNPKRSIVFCNSDANVEFVKGCFKSAGIVGDSPRVVVHSDVTFRNNHQTFDCVINFDVPYAPRVYAERLRAASDGSSCISLLCDYYSDFAQPILDKYPITCGWSPYAMRLPDRKKMMEWSTIAQPASSPQVGKARRVGQSNRQQGNRQVNKQPRAAESPAPAQKSPWARLVALFAKKFAKK